MDSATRPSRKRRNAFAAPAPALSPPTSGTKVVPDQKTDKAHRNNAGRFLTSTEDNGQDDDLLEVAVAETTFSVSFRKEILAGDIVAPPSSHIPQHPFETMWGHTRKLASLVFYKDFESDSLMRKLAIVRETGNRVINLSHQELEDEGMVLCKRKNWTKLEGSSTRSRVRAFKNRSRSKRFEGPSILRQEIQVEDIIEEEPTNDR